MNHETLIPLQTTFQLYNQGYGNLNYSILSDKEVQYVVDGAAARVTYHSSYANAEWWADKPFELLGALGPDTKIVGAASFFLGTNFIYQGIADQAKNIANLHPDFNYTQHVDAVVDNNFYNGFAQQMLDRRDELFPLAPGAPLDFPLQNYNGDPEDDYFGLVDQSIETIRQRMETNAIANRSLELFNQKTGEIGTPECFPAGTQIQLANGETAPIEALRAGDNVAAFDGELFRGRGGLEGHKVVRQFENITDTWIQLSNGLTVTPGHHFLDAKGGFRCIEDILADDGIIINKDGIEQAVTGEYIHYSAENADMFEQAEGYVAQSFGGTDLPQAGGLAVARIFKKGWKTYNFEVENFHTYVAGGVRVHNHSIDIVSKEQELAVRSLS